MFLAFLYIGLVFKPPLKIQRQEIPQTRSWRRRQSWINEDSYFLPVISSGTCDPLRTVPGGSCFSLRALQAYSDGHTLNMNFNESKRYCALILLQFKYFETNDSYHCTVLSSQIKMRDFSYSVNHSYFILTLFALIIKFKTNFGHRILHVIHCLTCIELKWVY